MKVCRVCKRERSVGSNTLGALAALHMVRDGEEEEEEAGVAGGEGGNEDDGGGTQRKFHRLREAYVAIGGKSRWEDTDKRGTEIGAGRIC